MIEDFIDDLKKDLHQQRSIEVDKLIAADGTSRHDLIRGRISGLDTALLSLTSLRSRYLRDEVDA